MACLKPLNGRNPPFLVWFSLMYYNRPLSILHTSQCLYFLFLSFEVMPTCNSTFSFMPFFVLQLKFVLI